MITFKKVRWKNFLSTGNTFIEIDLDRNSTTLIIGENGAGKSTVLDALCFGLFGKPFRGINKPQLLNSINMSECVVEIEFVIGTKKIKVVRGIRPNVFEIYINKKLYNQDANQRDYQKYLEQQILKLNYRSFTQVVILGSSTFVPFMQLKARHRRDVVEDILDIQIFSLMNMLLKQRLKGISENQRDVNYNHDLTDEKIILQKKYIDDVKTNKDKLIEEKNIVMSGNEEVVFKKKADIDFHTKNNEELLLAIKDSTKVNKDFAKLKDIKSTLTEKKNNRGRMVKFFKDNNDCPACEQPLRNASKMVKSKQKEVDKFTNALVELEQALKVSTLRQGEIGKITDRIRENEVYIAKENSSVTELQKFNATLLAEINQLETGDVGETDLNELDKLKKHLTALKKQATKLREDQTMQKQHVVYFKIQELKLRLLSSIFQL